MHTSRCHSKEGDKHTAWTNAEVLRYWQVLPSRFENFVRLVNWLREIILHPTNHPQVMAAVFGRVKVLACSAVREGNELQEDIVTDVLDESGRLIDGAPGVEFAKQFEDALLALEGISGTEAFFEEWNETGRSWAALLDCKNSGKPELEDLAHQVQRLDLSVLRAAANTKHIEFYARKVTQEEEECAMLSCPLLTCSSEEPAKGPARGSECELVSKKT